MKQTPTDLHLRRLALEYDNDEVRELATYLKLPYSVWNNLKRNIQDIQGETLRFQALRKCCDRQALTFYDIKKAAVDGKIQTPHTICKVSSRDSLIIYCLGLFVKKLGTFKINKVYVQTKKYTA